MFRSFGNLFAKHNRLADLPKVKFPSLIIRCISSSEILNVQPSAIAARTIKKTKKHGIDDYRKGFWNVVAYSTADEYDINELANKFKKNEMFQMTSLCHELKNPQFLHALITEEGKNEEPQEVFVFKEGSVVMWNLTDLDVEVILGYLTKNQQSAYSSDIIREECEVMNFKYANPGSGTKIIDDDILLAPPEEGTHDKYAVSNAMALSVKLGTWEASLNRYIDSMALITDDLKQGNRIKMSQAEVMRKTGELFSLRHAVNLSSDLLDTPDIYWDREELEKVYQHTVTYFCINKRTRVINEKLNHCIELVELLSSHLRDNHHVRLEWMIIILIMVEVVFEALRHIGDTSHAEKTT